MEAAGGEQPLSERERELVREAYERLEVFRDGCREMHERAREARRIALLDDPKQDPPGTRAEQRTLQMQTLKSTINNCVADQMDNLPEAVLLPETPELAPVAEDATDVVRFILDQNNYERVHKALAEDLFVTGTPIAQVVWDDDMDGGRGNVGVIPWPVEAFLWDPVSETIQDARAIIKVSWHPLSWYAARYPDAAKYVRGEDYAYENVGVPDAWAQKQAGDEDRAMRMEYWYRSYDAKARRHTIHVAILAGGALLEMSERDRPGGVYEHGMYPFAACAFNAIRGMPVGDGMVQELVPMMRYINRYAHYFDVNTRMSTKGRLLVRRGAQIDNDALTDYSRNIIEGEAIEPKDVNWLITPPFAASALNMSLQLAADLKQDSGQNQFTRGETAGGVTAASAIASLQEAGGKTSRMRTASLNNLFRDMVALIVWTVAQFYDEGRVRMVTGKTGETREIAMGTGRLFGKRRPIDPPPYTVQVQVQRRNPMRVQAQNELKMQAFAMAAQSGVPFPASALFEIMQVDGKDEVVPILRAAEERADQTRQMAQVIEQQGAQLQQASAEIEHLKQAVMATGGSPEGMYPRGIAEAGGMPETPEVL